MISLASTLRLESQGPLPQLGSDNTGVPSVGEALLSEIKYPLVSQNDQETPLPHSFSHACRPTGKGIPGYSALTHRQAVG